MISAGSATQNWLRWTLSPSGSAAIRRERIRRSKTSLLSATLYTYPRYRPDPVHALIAGVLDQVIAGRVRRVMIFAPPQHGKSELASVRLPACWLARRPHDPVIVTSYAASLALSKSRQARAVVESQEFAEIWPEISTDPTSRAVDHWQLRAPHRAGLRAAGIDGGITGHGAGLGVIDDPFESWEQAQSITYRDRAWNFYRGTFRTRIWEGGAILLIMTRWHEDDLAGRLLARQAEEWTVLRLPAIAEDQETRDRNNTRMNLPLGQPDPLEREPGQPLSPSRYSLAALLAIKRDVGDLVWQAEYQGAPTAPEGNRFKRHMFPILDAMPADLIASVRYWDKAASRDGKRTAGIRMAKTADGRYIIVDAIAGQWLTHQRRAVMKQTAQLDGIAVPVHIEQEPGSSGVDSVQDEIRLLEGYAIYADRPTGDKDTRLEPFAAQAGAGNVYLLRGPWNAEYIDELLAVPNGAYRDRADATAGAFLKLVSISAGSGESAAVPPRDPIKDYDKGDW